jgi:hypothetical protein
MRRGVRGGVGDVAVVGALFASYEAVVIISMTHCAVLTYDGATVATVVFPATDVEALFADEAVLAGVVEHPPDGTQVLRLPHCDVAAMHNSLRTRGLIQSDFFFDDVIHLHTVLLQELRCADVRVQ